MNELEIVVTPERVMHFMLVAARLGGVVAAAPLFGHQAMPVRIRVALTVAVAFAVAGRVPTGAAAGISDVWTLGGMLLVEALTGVMLGVAPQLIFGGVMLGGEMAGIHMGLGVARVIDPLTRMQATPIALWLQFLAMLVFLSLDVHHLIVRALVRSFTVAPPGTLRLDAPALGSVLGLVAAAFEVGVRVAAPVLAGLLIIDTALGLLARAIPELNVFIMGFAIKIAVGFFLLSAALPFTVRFLEHRFLGLDQALMRLVGALS